MKGARFVQLFFCCNNRLSDQNFKKVFRKKFLFGDINLVAVKVHQFILPALNNFQIAQICPRPLKGRSWEISFFKIALNWRFIQFILACLNNFCQVKLPIDL